MNGTEGTLRIAARKARKLLTPEGVKHIAALAWSLPFAWMRIAQLSRTARRRGLDLHLIVLCNQMGDVVAAEPAARNCKSDRAMTAWVVCSAFAPLVRHLSYIDSTVEVTCPSEWILLERMIRGVKKTNLHIDQHPCNWFGLRVPNKTKFDINFDNYYQKGNLLRAFSLQGLGIAIDERPRLGSRRDSETALRAMLPTYDRLLEGSFAAVHLTSTDAGRSLSRAQSQAIIKYVREICAVPIVEFGIHPLLEDDHEALHLGGSLELDLQAALLAKASFFVGVDSGFAHIANAAKVESLVLMGRHRHFVNHMPYSGPWSSGKGCEILRSTQLVSDLSIDEIRPAVARLIERAGKRQTVRTEIQ
jgi:heptosyltransferase-3